MYADYASLGILNAAGREIPFYNGKGQPEKSDEIKNTVFSFSLAVSVCVSAGILLYAAFSRFRLGPEIFYGLLFTSGLVLLQRFNALLIVFLRAYKEFSLAGRQMLYSALVNATLVGALSFRFKLYGFMIAMALSLVFNVVYIIRNRPFHFKIEWRPQRVRALVFYGFPLFLIALFGSFFDTITKLLITKLMGLESLGVYSVALMTVASIHSVPNSIGIVVIPNLHEKYGKAENKADLKGYLEKAALAYSTLIPLLVGLSWFVVPVVVRHWLPAFSEGIQPLRYLALSVYFMALVQGYSQFIYVIRKHLVLLPMLIFSCLVLFWTIRTAIHAGFGLEGVATASTLSFFVYFTMVYGYVAGHVYTAAEAVRRFASLMGRFACLLLTVWVIGQFVLLPDSLSRAAASSLLFLLAQAPFLIHLEKKLGILTGALPPAFKRFWRPGFDILRANNRGK